MSIENKKPYLYYIWLEEKIPLSDKFIIGRGSDASYRLDDKEISGKHCEFIVKNIDDTYQTEVYIKDLNSHNKTYVNNRRIVADYPLKLNDKDIISLSEQKFVFVWQSEDEFYIPEVDLEDLSKGLSKDLSGDSSNNMKSSNIDNDGPPVYIPDNISKDTQPEDLPEETSENMPENMPEDMPQYMNEIQEIKKNLEKLREEREQIEQKILEKDELSQNYEEVIHEIREIDKILKKSHILDIDAYGEAVKKIEEELQVFAKKKHKLTKLKELLDRRYEKVLLGKSIKKEIKELHELELTDKREFIDENMLKELQYFEQIKKKNGLS